MNKHFPTWAHSVHLLMPVLLICDGHPVVLIIEQDSPLKPTVIADTHYSACLMTKVLKCTCSYTITLLKFTSFPLHFQIYQLANEIGYYVRSIIITMLEMQNKEHIKGNDKVMTHSQMLNFSSDKEDEKCLLFCSTLFASSIMSLLCYGNMQNNWLFHRGWVHWLLPQPWCITGISFPQKCNPKHLMYRFIGFGLKVCRHLQVKRGKIYDTGLKTAENLIILCECRSSVKVF